MKIIVLSDTHGHINDAKDIISLCRKGTDLVIHLGDTCRDFDEISSLFPDLQMVGVAGNNDFFRTSVPNELFLNLDGIKFFISHGHQFGVKRDLDTLSFQAMSKGADIALFGHTHIQEKTNTCDLILFNSGAVCEGDFGIIHIHNGVIASVDKHHYDSFRGCII